MPGIFLIVVMVFLIALWIMGAYVDVKTIQKHNGHNSGLEGTRTEIVQEDNPKQKHSLQGENNAKGGHIESEAPPKMRATVFVAPPRTPFPIPLENDSLPDPDPVDIPRERMRFLRLPREEEPAPDSEDSRDTPIPDSSPENTGNILDATPEEDCEPIAVNHKDEMIQTDSSVANYSTQTVSHQQDIGVGEQLLIDDSAIQVVPEKQDAQTGEPLMVRDVPIQNVPEKQDASMEALPSHHDVSLGNHLSQHEQGVQYDLSTHSIGLDPSDIPVEEKSIQALKSLRDASLQNILVQESMGVGSHVSYRSQEMQAIPERNDASAQHSRNFKSIGVDPRSFHASDFSSLIISEGNHDSSSIKSSVKSENILDKIPLSQSVWIEKEEEQKQRLRDASLQNILVQESMGVGSHVSYRSQEMQAIPERNDASAQHSRNFKSIGVDPRSFHASDFSSLIISEGNHDSSSIKSSVKSENILDKIPLSQSVWIEKEEEQKQSSFNMPFINLDTIPLENSILLGSQIHRDLFEQKSVISEEVRVPSRKSSSEEFSIIPSHKSLSSHRSWNFIEDDGK